MPPSGLSTFSDISVHLQYYWTPSVTLLDTFSDTTGHLTNCTYLNWSQLIKGFSCKLRGLNCCEVQMNHVIPMTIKVILGIGRV